MSPVRTFNSAKYISHLNKVVIIIIVIIIFISFKAICTSKTLNGKTSSCIDRRLAGAECTESTVKGEGHSK